MLKKYITIFILCILWITSSIAQDVKSINIPNESWVTGGLRELTENDWEKINNFTTLKPSASQRNRELPPQIDNSVQPYFRPIFSQVGGSCGQASAMGYVFTYEINYTRNTPANIPQNQYPTHFTYNFVNSGSGNNGSAVWEGWEISQANGIPNVEDYGGMADFQCRRWLSGYDEYYNGMNNRVSEIVNILNVDTEEGLENLKGWLVDHHGESEIGGVTSFGANIASATVGILPYGTPHAGEQLITQWGEQWGGMLFDHWMTFVGYDDSIRYDYNNDGLYTNHMDTNGDEIIDMRDWEIGAMIIVNSWGTDWANGGFIYMPYRLFALPNGSGGVGMPQAWTVRTREYYDTSLSVKATVKHNIRNMIRITVGISPDTLATEPTFVQEYPIFNNQGGPYYMQGGITENHKTLELGLDISPLLCKINPQMPIKFFLSISEDDPYNQGNGEIVSFSVMDHISGNEIYSSATNIIINNNDVTTVSAIGTISPYSVTINESSLPIATPFEPYSTWLAGSGGSEPYQWDLALYSEEQIGGEFPNITSQRLIPSDFDNGFVIQDLDFSFPFFDKIYDNIVITTDGSIIFQEEYIPIHNQEELMANEAITVYGHDLAILPAQNDGIWYEGDENFATIRWKTTVPADPDVDAAVKLYPNGNIEFYYNDGISTGYNWIAGLANGLGHCSLLQISDAHNVPGGYGSMMLPSAYALNPAQGMTISPEGEFFGTPTQGDTTWNIPFRVTDFNGISETVILPFTTLQSNIQDSEVTTPAKAQLHQNYPNPFNPITNIQFDIPQDGAHLQGGLHLTLNIYDISGKLIKTLLNEKIEAGYHSIIWDGKDNNGQNVPSGSYFYSIENLKNRQVKQMVLLK